MPLRSCRNGYNYVAATIDDFLFEAATVFFYYFSGVMVRRMASRQPAMALAASWCDIAGVKQRSASH